MTDDLTPEAVKAALEAATPGKWTVHKRQDEDEATLVLSNDDYKNTSVAECGSWHTGASIDEAAANARLIAMAPAIATAYLAMAERIEAADRLAEIASYMLGRLELYSGHTDDQLVTDATAALAAYRATERQT